MTDLTPIRKALEDLLEKTKHPEAHKMLKVMLMALAGIQSIIQYGL